VATVQWTAFSGSPLGEHDSAANKRIPSADTNIGHSLPAVKKSGATALPANPYNRCRSRSRWRIQPVQQDLRDSAYLAGGASMRWRIPSGELGNPMGFGRDYIGLILAKQTISDSNVNFPGN
jgi:hypothetical protein